MISLDLSHNERKRLWREFIRPLEKWAQEHGAVVVWTETECNKGEVACIGIFPSHERLHNSSAEPLAEFTFLENGECVKTHEDSPPKTYRTWSAAARAMLALVYQVSLEDIQRARKLEAGLAKLKPIIDADLERRCARQMAERQMAERKKR